MQTDSRPDPVPTFSPACLDQIILNVISRLNAPGSRPQATPRLVSELLDPDCRGPRTPVDVPLPAGDSFGYLNPEMVRSRLDHLIRSRFLVLTRSGRIFLPEIPGRPL